MAREHVPIQNLEENVSQDQSQTLDRGEGQGHGLVLEMDEMIELVPESQNLHQS